MDLSTAENVSDLTASDAVSGLDGMIADLTEMDRETIAELGLEAVPSAALKLRLLVHMLLEQESLEKKNKILSTFYILSFSTVYF